MNRFNTALNGVMKAGGTTNLLHPIRRGCF